MFVNVGGGGGGGEEVTGPVVFIVEADIRFDLGLFGSWVGFVCNCWRAFVFLSWARIGVMLNGVAVCIT